MMTPVNRPTSIAEAIAATTIQESRMQYDRACKRLLSEKSILAHIMHECLDEFREVSPTEIAERYIEGTPQVGEVPLHDDTLSAGRVRGLNSEDTSLSEGTIWYDIRFQAIVPGTDETIGMIVNVEAQNEFRPGYSLLQRAMYYCARMISSQYGRVFSGSHYERLQKVCSIWICPNPPARFRNTITRYSMAEEHLVGTAKSKETEYDLVEIVLACPDGDRQKKGDGILRLLGTLFASDEDAETRKAIIGEEFGIPMTEQLSGEVNEMLDFSKGVLEKGLQKGFEQGLAQGMEQGIEQGIARGIEQGKAQYRDLVARLAVALKEQGREDELVDALADDEAFQQLLAEFGLAE